MSVLEKVQAIAREQMLGIANTIEGEMKGIVSGHTRSGKALGAIHVEQKGETSYFIGGTDGTGKGITGTDHLAMLDQGNGTKIIYPKGRANGGANALRFDDGSFHGSARPYAGINFVAQVANRHR